MPRMDLLRPHTARMRNRDAFCSLAFMLALAALILIAPAASFAQPGNMAPRPEGQGKMPGMSGKGLLDSAMPMDGMMQGMAPGMMGGMMGEGPGFEQEIIETLASFGDRSTGTPGCDKAADYIASRFEALGVGETGRLSYQIPVIRHNSARIVLENGKEEALSPTALNAITPGSIPPEGLKGEIIYAGKGEFKEFNGKTVAGAVVLMELDSGKNWINAAQLGAKALIYIDRGVDGKPASRGFYQDKFELTPIRFPRFIMPLAQAQSLFGPLDKAGEKSGLGTVSLFADARWEQVIAQNVYLFIPGTDEALSGETLLVDAFYDSEAYVPGNSPGADEASSMAALLRTAWELKKHPPARSVLLAAVSGHAQANAGMRELVAAMRVKGRELRDASKDFKASLADDKETVKALEAAIKAKGLDKTLEAPQIGKALETSIKDGVDQITTTLMRLRLKILDGEGKEHDQEALTLRRALLRRLSWRQEYKDLSDEEREAVVELLPGALAGVKAGMADVKDKLRCVADSRELRRKVGDKEIVAGLSLYLSSHGDAVGSFCDGWMYELKPEININQAYSFIGRFLNQAAARLEREERFRILDNQSMYVDGLRADQSRPWRSYFVDNPLFGSETASRAGIMALALATVNDGRNLWGTPGDTPALVDMDNLWRQSRFVSRLIHETATANPLEIGDKLPRNVFSTLSGRANFIRQGELFPDRPAPGTVVMLYQGKTRYYAMVDAKGKFRVTGLSSKKYVYDKAIIEAFRLSPDTGEAIWAVDKKQTGKDAYRVKMDRTFMETDLIMFGCDQSTMFSAFDPRTFNYFTKIELLDGRREAPPMRSWFSRLDTRDSTLFTLFLEPGTSYKLILSDTVLARKLILLNASKAHPEGVGYNVADWPVLPVTEMKAARDIWDLLSPRIENLERHGIFNDRIRALEADGVALLKKSQTALAEKRYDEMAADARSSWALSTRVYNDVEKTQKDVLIGVLFYIALFVPFAYCLERVIFCFADIHKRIVAFIGILFAVIAVVYQVHPAFQLTYSPLVVILAFFILGLSLMVSMIIFFRFEREMVDLQKRAMHVKTTEIGGFKAFTAAFVIGVSNLRRRKLRTILTCLTLIILTFTIMSFTAVKSTRTEGAVKFTDAAPYQGALLKNIGWRTLPPETFGVLQDMFAGRAGVSPLAWLEDPEKTKPVVTELRRGKETELAQGVIGLTSAEADTGWIKSILVKGRWFKPGERRTAVLPLSMAARLGVEPGVSAKDQVIIWGMPFTVVGVIKDNGLDEYLDLDGEPLTPVVFPSETAVEMTETEKEAVESGEDVRSFQSRYQHVDGDLTIVVPYDTLMGMGGQLKSISVGGASLKGAAFANLDRNSAAAVASKLADRFGLAIYSGEPDGAFVYHSSDSLSYAGVPNIIIPLVISVLIVLNTMIGSVFERKREIGVYTAVGLAPTHVSFLFIAESLAFAVLSVVLGYLLAQTAAGLFSGTSLWAGMTANYSSLAGVAAMLLVIAVVLLSVIYPSKVAGEIAIPDVNRSWTLPEPEQGVIHTMLPFLMRIREQECAGGFLFDYYNSHQDISHGLFSTDRVEYAFECPWTRPGAEPHPKEAYPEFSELRACMRLTATVWLAPFDFGIKQRVTLYFIPALSNPGFMEIKVELERLAGEAGMWKRLNKGFLNDLRKQLLIWRSLDEAARYSYEQSIVTSYPE